MSGSFFMSYSFKARANGFYGKLEGQKIYSIECFEEVERLINDALKVLKTGNEAEVTFEHFANWTTCLSRIYTGFDGKAETVIWNYRTPGSSQPSSTDIEKIQINKKEVKAFVLRAIELFRDKEREASAA